MTMLDLNRDTSTMSSEDVAQELIALERRKTQLLQAWKEKQMARIARGEVPVEHVKSSSTPRARQHKDWFDKLGF